MSTVAFAALTTKRDQSPAGKSFDESAPGLKPYVDVLAALVPTEVLTIHAAVLSLTTTIQPAADGSTTTLISDPGTLSAAFVGLIVMSMLLYAVTRGRQWDRLDLVRILIPPAAFLGWTMAQRATAFDAIAPHITASQRGVAALFLAVILGVGATALAYRADKKEPTPLPAAKP